MKHKINLISHEEKVLFCSESDHVLDTLTALHLTCRVKTRVCFVVYMLKFLGDVCTDAPVGLPGLMMHNARGLQ